MSATDASSSSRVDWDVRGFEDCLEPVKLSKKIPRKQFLAEGAFPIVSQEEAFINGRWDNEADTFRVDKPVVIYGDHTQVIKYVDFDFVLGADGVKVLLPKSFLKARFFYYFLMAHPVADLGYARHYRHLKQLRVSFPALSEQERIVGILDEAFAGIATATAHAERNLHNARELFQSVLQSTFEQKGEDWVETTIGNVCQITHGFAFKGKDFEKGNDLRKPIVLTPGNFTEEGTLSFVEKNTKRLSGETPDAFRFAEGDLVVVMTDLSSKMKILGKPAFIQQPNVLHNQRIGKVIVENESVMPRFLYYFFRTDRFLRGIKASATGTMVKHTAPKRIRAAWFSYPTEIRDQESIVQKLDALAAETRRLEAVYERKLAALAELKQSLLHRAFSGQL